MTALTAKHSFEIEIELTGTFVRGYPMRGPSFDSPGEPGEPDSVVGVDIAEIGALKHLGLRRWNVTDLLKGVDRNSPAYRQIVQNILEYLGEEADQALLEECGE